MAMVRVCNAADVFDIARLFDEYRIFYGHESDLPGAEQFLLERIRNEESVILMAIDNQDNCVGFTQLYPLFSSTRMKRLWLLNDLFVDPAYRGRGFSIALINEAKLLCKRANAAGIILETAKTNVIGNALYPRADFVLDIEHNYYSWECP